MYKWGSDRILFDKEKRFYIPKGFKVLKVT